MIGELCRTHNYTASRLRQQPVAAGNGGWLQQLFKGRTLVLQSWRNVFDKLNKTYTNLTQLSFLRRLNPKSPRCRWSLRLGLG